MDALSSLARACGKDGGERAVIQDRIFSELRDGKIADLYENFSRANAREECALIAKGRCCAKRTTCFQSLGKSNRSTPVQSR